MIFFLTMNVKVKGIRNKNKNNNNKNNKSRLGYKDKEHQVAMI